MCQGTLDLAKRLGLSMPDVPHEELVASLLDAWDCIVYKTGHTRKQMYRKVRLLEFGRQKKQQQCLMLIFFLYLYYTASSCATSCATRVS